MNERIKELALQAGIEFTYDPTETPTRAFVECWVDDMEKFAELIVRECADKAHEFIVGDGNQFPITSVAYRIKQHFGVEE